MKYMREQVDKPSAENIGYGGPHLMHVVFGKLKKHLNCFVFNEN